MEAGSGWRKKLYIIIFEADTRMGKLFDVVLLWAIILSVLSIILESDDGIRNLYGTELRYIEWFFTVLFSAEYIVRLLSVKRPINYAKSFFGIIDLISVIPTYISLFVPGTQYLLVIRAIRLLRVFRVLKLVRYSRESQTLLYAMKASTAKITVFLGAVLTAILIVGTAMHIIEGDNPGFSNILKSMYWGVVTMTTVGYGDAVPMTAAGKFLASVVMIIGYGVIAVPTGIISAELSSAKLRGDLPGLKCLTCHIDLDDNAKFCHLCGDKAHSHNLKS